MVCQAKCNLCMLAFWESCQWRKFRCCC